MKCYLLSIDFPERDFPIPTILWGPGNQEDAEAWAILNGYVIKGDNLYGLWYADDDREEHCSLKLEWR